MRTRTGVAWRFRLLSKAVRFEYEFEGMETFCRGVPAGLAAKYGGFRGARYVLSLKEWHYPLTEQCVRTALLLARCVSYDGAVP